jgi:hypothetical protein
MRQITGIGSGLSFGQAMTRDVRALSAATRDFGRAASLPASMLAALGGRAVYNLQKTGNTIQAVTDITDEQRASLEEYMRSTRISPSRTRRLPRRHLSLPAPA